MIEVGEYIRTKEGYITKICECLGKDVGYKNMQHYDVDNWIPYRGFIIYKEDIKVHSKNIIDLIEVGDYVNGMRVIATENRGRYNEEKQKDEKVILTENYDEWTENGVVSNEDIKTILTHEQYEQNSYKVVI